MSTTQMPGGPDDNGLHNKTIKVYDRPEKAPGLSPAAIAVIVIVAVAIAAYLLLRHHAGIHA